MSLPTYQEATRKPSIPDALKLVAPYLEGCRDLASCCRVNKEWRRVFMDVLWENPLSNITSQGEYSSTHMRRYERHFDCVSEQFARFYALLPFSPLAASRIRILDNREWYCDPRSEFADTALAVSMAALRAKYCAQWKSSASFIKGYEDDLEVKDITTVQEGVRRLATSPILPNANFLILDSMAESDPGVFNPLRLWDRHPLLLSLEGVHLDLNPVVELGVPRVPFLDKIRYLSFNRSLWHSTAFVRTPLSLFGVFANVKVLKLQHCGITDHDLSLLATHQLSLNQLTCLDLRDNHLTDDCLEDLGVFLSHTERESGTVYPYHINSMVESVPQYQEIATDPEHQVNQRIDRDAETIPDDIDEFIAWAKKRGDLDVVPNTGLTQLYLSRNELSFNAVMFILLMAHPVLRTFDCGAMPATLAYRDIDKWSRYLPEEYTRTRWRNRSPYSHMRDRSPIPLAVALCSHQHAPKLERLTVHHSFVTYEPDNPSPNNVAGPPYVATGPGGHTPSGLVTTPNEMHSFRPEVNPNIQYLELAGMPEFAPRRCLRYLRSFLRLATKLDRDLMVYRSRQNPKGRRAPRVLPGLKKLVIVLTKKYEDDNDMGSATEDPDAERFVRESENDFSFFEEDTQRGEQLVGDRDLYRRRTDLLQVRADLAEFRKETREAYAAVKREKGVCYADHHIEEHWHWKGQLVVVRPSG